VVWACDDNSSYNAAVVWACDDNSSYNAAVVWTCDEKGGEQINRRVLDMKVEGVRARGRQKRRWADCVTEDIKERHLEGTDVRGRRKWRKAVMNIDPTRVENTKREKTGSRTVRLRRSVNMTTKCPSRAIEKIKSGQKY